MDPFIVGYRGEIERLKFGRIIHKTNLNFARANLSTQVIAVGFIYNSLLLKRIKVVQSVIVKGVEQSGAFIAHLASNSIPNIFQDP